MDKKKQIVRMARNAVMLALLCVIGMFSLPLGDNIKVSLQLLMFCNLFRGFSYSTLFLK